MVKSHAQIELDGPNVKKLIIYLVSRKAVPDGGGIGAGLNFLLNQDLAKASFKEAIEEAISYINQVKATKDPAWQDNEKIAAEILRRVAEHG